MLSAMRVTADVSGFGMPTLTFAFIGSSQGYQMLHIHSCGDHGDYIAFELNSKL